MLNNSDCQCWSGSLTGPRLPPADDVPREHAIPRVVGFVDLEAPTSTIGSRSHVNVEGQRVALARATLHDPDLLLVDEPFSGLDEASAAALPAILRREGRTLVVATHDVERGKAIADRIVTLERGRVVSA